MKGLLVGILVMVPLLASAEEWQSGPSQTDIVELYTSEGCSSCPPADKWLTSLKQQPGLFKEFIPVAFHVDYWDYIGWKDRFAKPSYSERQRQYVREGLVSQAYTPELVINSREWRQWFRGQRQWQPSDKQVGVLSANLQGNQLRVEFDQDRACVLHVAYLGMGLASEVRAGENRGRRLAHDFVVLDILTKEGQGNWQVTLPPRPEAGQEQTALAVWVSPQGSQEVLQSTGGYLKASP
ncbi:DUF1223 domain-containing protein [Hahella sp. CCB-MM4]|uniref:DUF1223 domain-containing protein n=1 Tax=Hahella sp. (strain CCB-MM4) TaxID=1926491 RepID=UPI000B9B6F3C|nr:DUF1223 domain-containing protein [Hahella sp. CCB-MM4]OZG74992.1 DUF1223 domain-containing protein [Hahella sp. CCB-MM4]